MKKIIILLLAIITINAASAQQPPVADTIPLLTIKDYQLIEKHLEDKLLAKDYKVIMNALNELYAARVNEYLAKKPATPEPKQKSKN